MTRDSGSIVVGWLTKVAAGVSLLGLLAFDGIALVQANFTTSDRANTAASVAADAYKGTHDVQTAYNAAAVEAAKSNGAVDTKTFTVQQSDGHITLTLHEEATTLWMHRVGFLKKYVTVTATGESSPIR